MTSGPTLPLWIGRSKFLFPTVSVAVLLLGFASIRGPRCMVKRAGPGGPDEISRGRPDVPEGTGEMGILLLCALQDGATHGSTYVVDWSLAWSLSRPRLS